MHTKRTAITESQDKRLQQFGQSAHQREFDY